MKRALPFFIAFGLAVAAFIAAFAVNLGVRYAVAVPDGTELAKPEVGDAVVAASENNEPETKAPARVRSLTRKQFVDSILGRNIFDSAAIGKAAAVEESGGQAITDLNVKLIATIVAEPEQFSSALIAESSGGASRGYGIGDRIMDAEIISIEKKKVTLKRGDGNIEVLTMDAKEENPETGAPAAGAPAAEGLEGVTSLGENKYAVDRNVLTKYMGDLDGLSKLARPVPHKDADGNIDGYRLSGIRRNSPLSQLGIKNGDIIHNVNGQSLASPTDAMGAFSALQTSSSFSFDITRRGQKQTMEYEIR